MEQQNDILQAEEVEVGRSVLKTFLLGVGCGIGLTVFCLYVRRPGWFAASVEMIAGAGRNRRRRQDEESIHRERLKAADFSEDEMTHVF